tara:strand:+ start:2752 stop:3531 length:780 start_codon:yes stop_codon:yes gene_type:complete
MTTIFTSHKFSIEECPNNLRKNLDKWRLLNPSYDFKYYNDDDMNSWMKENVSETTFGLFNRLNTGAAKADMFRICLLHTDGGIWFDTDLPAFDISKERADFQELLVENEAVLIRNRRCDNPRYTLIAGSKGSHLFKLLQDTICNKIQDCVSQGLSTDTINITGPFTLHKILLEMCGFENVLRAGPRAAWPQGFAFTGSIELNQAYEISNGIKFIYINDVVPRVPGTGPQAYQKENTYEGYESDLLEMDVSHHTSSKAVN